MARTRIPALLSMVLVALPGSLALAEEKEPAVVAKITKVEYAIEKIKPPNLVVTAAGEVNTGGYTKTQLVRVLYVQPPEDGIQDYFLMTVPPSGIVTQVISTVTAQNTWKNYEAEAPWIKGVRVRGLDGGVMVKKFDEKPK